MVMAVFLLVVGILGAIGVLIKQLKLISSDSSDETK